MADVNSMSIEKLRVLELYSGIGGMHWALEESGIPYEIVMAVDINTSANHIYEHNFPQVNLHSFGIEKLTLKKLSSLSCNAILMSPPCQPFTRVGKKADCDDVRTKSFLHILKLVRELNPKPKYILVENVKGFETSKTRLLLVEMLQECHYSFQEFLLNPLQFGIPNSRLRYFVMARMAPWPQCFKLEQQVLCSLPTMLKDSNHQAHKDSLGTSNLDFAQSDNQKDSSDITRFPHVSSPHQSKPTADQVNKDQTYSVSSCVNAAEVVEKEISPKDFILSEDDAKSESSSYSTKHLCHLDDEQSCHRNLKRLKTVDTSCHVSSNGDVSQRQETTFSYQKEIIDLLNAGRNMRFCEEEDILIKADCHSLSNYLECGDEEYFKAYLLTDKNLSFFVIMDIVLPALKKSTCFTKRYGHYIEGAGSLVQMSSSVEATKAASALKTQTVNLKNRHQWGETELSILRKLKLRYFTPREVANLMSFPSEFSFPCGLSDVQKYRVLGNSLNVHVVSELIKFMVAI